MMSNEWRGWMNLNREYLAKRPDRLLLVGTLGPEEIEILAVNVNHFAIVKNDAGFDFGYRALAELEDALERAFPTAPMVRAMDDRFGVLLPAGSISQAFADAQREALVASVRLLDDFRGTASIDVVALRARVEGTGRVVRELVADAVGRALYIAVSRRPDHPIDLAPILELFVSVEPMPAPA